VDLDIDVIRTRDDVIIDDEDEFADHRVRMSYPDEVVAQVLEATAEATRLLHQRAFPFDREAHIP
jgi:protein associated with RNAse G/E